MFEMKHGGGDTPLSKNSKRLDTIVEKNYNSYMKKYSFKNGFTLAEVLITLGIIGVVAALTIPTLVNNYQKRQTVIKLKKVFADINNVVKLSEVDNGPSYNWDYPKQTVYDYDTIAAFIEKYYLPYYKSAKLYKREDFDLNYKIKLMNLDEFLPTSLTSNYLVLSDGKILSFFSNIPSGYMWIFADINGTNPPNKIGRDVFVFSGRTFSIEQTKTYGKYNIRFWTTTDANKIKREQLTDAASAYGCNKESKSGYGGGFYCGALIQLDGWRIDDSYPW